MTQMQLSRRAFITTAVAVGGGMVLGFNFPRAAEAAAGVNGELWNVEIATSPAVEDPVKAAKAK
jgi:hypothetical protein